MPSLGVFAAGSAGKAYLSVTNVQGATITKGMAVALAIAGNSFNGNNAVLAASAVTGNLPGFAGVANDDIANTASGLVQCWGYAASVYLSRTNTSVTINQGDPLVPGAEAGGLTSAAPTFANAGFRYILASAIPVTLSNAVAAAYASGQVRCL